MPPDLAAVDRVGVGDGEAGHCFHFVEGPPVAEGPSLEAEGGDCCLVGALGSFEVLGL